MSLITITAGIGCGAEAIARLLAQTLNLVCYDDQGLQEKAVAMGVASDDLRGLDERMPGLFNRLLHLKPESYLEVMEAVIFEISGQDDAIILGHGAPFLLRDFDCALHLRIYATDASRIDYLVDTQGVSSEAAGNLIRKSDHERKGFMQFAFRINWDDPSLFDLIINKDKLGIDGAVEVITAARQTENINVCSLSALDAMERMALAKRVEATIIKNVVNPGNYHVTVPEVGIVYLTGLINPLESKDRLLDAVKSVSGVKEVYTDLDPERIHDF